MKRKRLFVKFITMNSTKKFFDHNVLAITSLMICMVIVAYLKGFSHFAITDDVIISHIIAGNYGESVRPYLLFVNYALGWILYLCTKIFAQLNWFGTFLIVVGLFSFIQLFLLIDQITTKTNYYYVSCFLLLLLFTPVFIDVTYTQTSGFALSIVLLTDLLVLHGKINDSRYLQGSTLFLLFAAYTLRKDVLMALMPIYFIEFIFSIARCYKCRRTKWLDVAKRYIMPILLIFSLYAIDKFAYALPGWQDTQTYVKARQILVDYGHMDYQANESFFKDLGYTENDMNLFYRLNYSDSKVFPLDNFYKMATYRSEQIKNTPIHVLSLIKLQHNIEKQTFSVFYTGIPLVCGIYVLLLLTISLDSILVYVVMESELLFLLWRGRYIFRANFCLYVFAFLIFFFKYLIRFTDQTIRLQTSNSKRFLEIIFPFSLCIFLLGNFIASKENIFKHFSIIQQDYNYAEYIYSWREITDLYPDNLYLYDPTLFPITAKVLQPIKKHTLNAFSLGSWANNTLIENNILQRYGLDSNTVYEALIHDSRVYFVDRGDLAFSSQYIQYFKDHYHYDVIYKVVDQNERFKILKFYINN